MEACVQIQRIHVGFFMDKMALSQLPPGTSILRCQSWLLLFSPMLKSGNNYPSLRPTRECLPFQSFPKTNSWGHVLP